MPAGKVVFASLKLRAGRIRSADRTAVEFRLRDVQDIATRDLLRAEVEYDVHPDNPTHALAVRRSPR